VFDERFEQEKVLNKAELVAYDIRVAERLSPAAIRRALITALDDSTSVLHSAAFA
jgi:hypothetical protein